MRAQQCARRGRSPHLVQRRHRTPGRDAHARTERLDITKSQRSTVNRVVIFSAGWNGRHVVPTHPSYWTPPLDPPSRRGGLDLRLLETSNRPTNDVEFLQKLLTSLKKLIFAHTRCARGGHFAGTDPVLVSQGRWPMIPSGVCDLVYCGAGCLGLSRGRLDLEPFRKSNRPSGRGEGLDLGFFGAVGS